MVRVIQKTVTMIAGDNDIYINEAEDCGTRLMIYTNKDEDNLYYYFNALTSDGLQKFHLSRSMVKELVDKLTYRLENLDEDNF